MRELLQTYNDAIARHAAGHIGDAIGLLRRAAALAPSALEPQLALGTIAHQRAERPAALRWLARALAINPDSTEALAAQAFALSLEREPSAAMRACRRAIVRAPALGALWTRFGHALRAQGAPAMAIGAFGTATRLDPEDAVAFANLAAGLHALGRSAAALSAARKALALQPGNPDLLYNLATLGGGRAALAGHSRALAIDWMFGAAHLEIGVLLHADDKLDAARIRYRRAAAISPAASEPPHHLGALSQQQGRQDAAETLLRRAASLAADNAKLYSDYLFCLCFQERPSAPDVLDVHRDFDRRFARRLGSPALRHANDRDPLRRLRIGYVSANLSRHPVGHALLGVFEAHDRRSFHITAYAGNPSGDDVTARLRVSADRWTPIASMSDEALAQAVRADRIDILVDCLGHLPRGRLLAFARMPAPVQVSFPVYPNTTGVSAIGYRIADRHTSPNGCDGLYSERLLRLPEIHACYQAFDQGPDPATGPPSALTGRFTFGSFNNPTKIGAQTLALWAGILRRLPEARLCLKWRGMSPNSPLIAALCDLGVRREQLTVLGWTPSPYEPYRHIDCCLDPIVNGGNTTLDALWMGVPIITLRGEHLFARVGANMLRLVGLECLIADDLGRYCDIARALANDLPRLKRLRHGLRERLLDSPAMNAPRYTRFLEMGYKALWSRWCAGLSPAALTIGTEGEITWQSR